MYYITRQRQLCPPNFTKRQLCPPPRQLCPHCPLKCVRTRRRTTVAPKKAQMRHLRPDPSRRTTVAPTKRHLRPGPMRRTTVAPTTLANTKHSRVATTCGRQAKMFNVWQISQLTYNDTARTHTASQQHSTTHTHTHTHT